MKRGSYVVNTARGKLANREDIVAALESGEILECYLSGKAIRDEYLIMKMEN